MRVVNWNWLICIAACLTASTGVAEQARAQSSSLFHSEPSGGERPGISLEQASWTFVPSPPPKTIQLHDIVTVRVDILARMQAEGEMQRRKTALYDAVLKDWLRFDGLDTIKPAPQSDGDPRVQGTLNQQYRAEGDMETRESLVFNMPAAVVDIRPNGNLVLEGHQEVVMNKEVWMLAISGICSAEAIGPDRVVLSRDLLHMHVDKKEHGHVRDSYGRGWLVYWFDRFNPF